MVRHNCVGGTGVEAHARSPTVLTSLPVTANERPGHAWVDGQGTIILIGGTLLILISFFTSYSHVDIPCIGAIPVDQQVGIPLHLAALAALVGEVELEARVRDRTADEMARTRERTVERAQLQARLAVGQSRFLLTDSAANRLQLSNALAAVLEELVQFR